VAEGHFVRALVRDPRRVGIDGAESLAWDAKAWDATALLDGCDAVVHVAAHIPKNMADPGEARTCVEVNALGTLSLLESAARAGVGRFVHFSSGNVYLPRDGAVAEDAPAFPAARAPYYLGSKLLADVYVEHARRAQRIEGAILRVSSVYGPGMGEAGLVPTFARRLRAGQMLEVADGGRFASDLVFVDDVVEGAVRVLAAKAQGIFNIGSGQLSTVLDVARTMARLAGRNDALAIAAPADGPVNSGFAPLDIERARRELGYAPRTLAQGLEAYLGSF
jgi:UDP-glucose 4-epimerase